MKSEVFSKYDDALCRTVREEFGFQDLPIVTNMDFGHTDPMFVIPIGMRIRIDSFKHQISIDEPAVIDDTKTDM